MPFARGTLENAVLSVDDLIDDDLECLVHDLMNPISTIALAVDTLGLPVDEDRSRTALSMIRRNLAFLERLVGSLLDVTRRRPAPTVPVDLATVLEQAVESVPVEQRSRIRVDGATRPRALVDSVQIQRVITNLISNALAYTPPQSRIEVQLETRADWARISVIDRGPGLRFDDARRIFEKYERADASVSGSGLGLYLCRKIVEGYGGRIAVEAAQHGGSWFYFELPLLAV